MARLLLLGLAMLVSSCSLLNSRIARNSVEIATYDTRTGEVSSFNSGLFRSEFPDGVPITSTRVQRLQGRYYVIVAGARNLSSIPAGSVMTSCRMSRMPLDDDGQGTLSLREVVETQSCAGVNCESCAFAPHPDVTVTTGCVCLRTGSFVGPLGYCNHTITRTTTINLLRTDPRRESES